MRNSSMFLAFAFPQHDDQMMISSGRVEGGVEKTIFLLPCMLLPCSVLAVWPT